MMTLVWNRNAIYIGRLPNEKFTQLFAERQVKNTDFTQTNMVVLLI